jgi:hypothetical protein
MEGIALSNWTFQNNVIKGVNQGVAREAADIFIGNSVPVSSCLPILLLIVCHVIHFAHFFILFVRFSTTANHLLSAHLPYPAI